MEPPGPMAPVTLPIHTPRFTISVLTAADADAFTAYRDNPDVARHQGWDVPYTRADADRIIANQPVEFPPLTGDWVQLAIHPNAAASAAPNSTTPNPHTNDIPDPDLIPGPAPTHPPLLGDLALHTLPQPNSFEIGLTVSPGAQRTGVGSEALRALVDALFAAGAHRVSATTDVHNPAVGGCLRKVGFRLEGTKREVDWHKGAWQTLQDWGMLRGDWGGAA